MGQGHPALRPQLYPEMAAPRPWLHPRMIPGALPHMRPSPIVNGFPQDSANGNKQVDVLQGCQALLRRIEAAQTVANRTQDVDAEEVRLVREAEIKQAQIAEEALAAAKLAAERARIAEETAVEQRQQIRDVEARHLELLREAAEKQAQLVAEADAKQEQIVREAEAKQAEIAREARAAVEAANCAKMQQELLTSEAQRLQVQLAQETKMATDIAKQAEARTLAAVEDATNARLDSVRAVQSAQSQLVGADRETKLAMESAKFAEVRQNELAHEAAEAYKDAAAARAQLRDAQLAVEAANAARLQQEYLLTEAQRQQTLYAREAKAAADAVSAAELRTLAAMDDAQLARANQQKFAFDSEAKQINAALEVRLAKEAADAAEVRRKQLAREVGEANSDRERLENELRHALGLAEAHLNMTGRHDGVDRDRIVQLERELAQVHGRFLESLHPAEEHTFSHGQMGAQVRDVRRRLSSIIESTEGASGKFEEQLEHIRLNQKQRDAKIARLRQQAAYESPTVGASAYPRPSSPSRPVTPSRSMTHQSEWERTVLGQLPRNGTAASSLDFSFKDFSTNDSPNVWSHIRQSPNAGQLNSLLKPGAEQDGKWPESFDDGHCRSHPSQIRKQRKPKHVLMRRSAGASRVEPREIDWSHADPAKWKFESTVFGGGYSLTPKTEFEKYNGRIEDGLNKVKSDPGTYEGIFYQTDTIDWPAEEQKYTLVKRNGCGFSVKSVQGGAFTYVHAKFEALRPNVQVRPDKYTDKMSYGGYYLGTPLFPGRGQGCADVPDLKIIDDSDPNDVTQGGVGDCWLLSAISALSEYDGAIRHLFRKTRNLERLPENGPNSYVVTLYDLPTWKPVDIVIDERLCSKPDGGLLGCHPSATGELWVCYLEKAIAVHCGGWDKIDGGTCDHAWRLLTGCKEQYTIRRKKDGYFHCFGSLNANTKQWEALQNSPHDGFRGLWPMPWPEVGGGGEDPKVDENGLFERMCAWEDSNYILAAGTRAGSDTNTTDGIVDGHAYCILNCINDAGGTEWDMIKLRNPHGHGEFTIGRWCDDGEGWKSYPKVKQACNPVQADDGVFWMDKSEFFKYFETVYLCACDMSEFVKSLSPRK